MRDIAERVAAGERVTEGDALAMLATPDINGLGAIADAVRARLHDRRAFYGCSVNLNYTNVCELRCPLCAFSCDEGDSGAYVLDMEEVARRVRHACDCGVDQVHIVGALNPALELDYYRQLVSTVKAVREDLYIVGFTATEYDYMSQISGASVDRLLTEFREAGVSALPGGGAEVFDAEVRQRIAPKKISGDQWLAVMRTAHRVGLRSNATLLYNHVETDAHVVDHLRRLRALQDETGGFQALVPLPYHGERTEVPARRRRPTGLDTVRLFATARIYLDNFPHIKALWMYLGWKTVQALMYFGVDDIGATYLNEKIVHAAGASTPDSGSEEALRGMIQQAGFTPVRTNAGYEKASE